MNQKDKQHFRLSIWKTRKHPNVLKKVDELYTIK